MPDHETIATGQDVTSVSIPLVSVVMPAYNTAAFIRDAIESILNQTLQQFELIIVDDGSQDGTGDIASEYAARDARIRVIPGAHRGTSHAMNRGIDVARADWVAVMHADDIALPQRLERQYQAAQADPQVVIWGTDGYHINSQRQIVSRFRVGPGSVAECQRERQQNRVVQCIHPTAMLRRDVLLAVGGYDTSVQVAEDIELFDRMMIHGPLVTIREPLLGYRVHGSSLSMRRYFEQLTIVHFVAARQKHRQQTGAELTLDAFRQQDAHRSRLWKLNEYRRHAAGMYYRRAGMAYGENQPLKLAGYLLLSLLLSPPYPIKRAWQQVLSQDFIGLRRQKINTKQGQPNAGPAIYLNATGQISEHADADNP